MAERIERDFEPAWHSVRPVPTVNIDFGGGHVVTRTLHGNVATLVITPDGFVVDALPGIQTPDAYLAQLDAAAGLARSLAPGPDRDARFRAAHAGLSAPPRRPTLRLNAKRPATKFMAKSMVEDRVEDLIEPDGLPELLEDDSQRSVNELARAVHAKLAEVGLVRPRALVKWLYCEVLHADLDDPYLGLGPTLFRGYPFAN